MKRVVVGLSGGVDSSVAALLLKEQGYDVVGLFMRNWHDTTGTLEGDCPWRDDELFAELVAKKLDIPFHFVDLSVDYRKRVVDYMFDEYARGRTPNPDVLCNREIKFDAFLKEAFRLGADAVATGHYCQRGESEGGEFRLLAGADKGKDQSYFLCQLSQSQLHYAMFPIGHLQKSEVRRLAAEAGLATAQRKDSQGICFVGKVDLPVFLQQQLATKQGNIVEIPASWSGYSAGGEDRKPFHYTPSNGVVVGRHEGAHFYTIGQRHGLAVGGTPEPLFVIATDVASNIVYVGQGKTHPGLFRRALRINAGEVHWVRPGASIVPPAGRRLQFRIRYRQPLQGGVLHVADADGMLSEDGAIGCGGGMLGRYGAIGCGGGMFWGDGGAYIIFDEPQRGVTAGQFAAWYDGDELLGSGVIAE